MGIQELNSALRTAASAYHFNFFTAQDKNFPLENKLVKIQVKTPNIKK